MQTLIYVIKESKLVVKKDGVMTTRWVYTYSDGTVEGVTKRENYEF